MRTRVSLIVAMDREGVIGRDGDLPWRLSADLQRFKKLTMGHAILMGRKTFESIGRLLPGRTSIVITRQANYDTHGALVAHSLREALQLAVGDSEAFIIGGAEIYGAALPLADRLYLTEVDASVTGDAHFPEFDRGQWVIVDRSSHAADERNEFAHTFAILDRAQPPASSP